MNSGMNAPSQTATMHHDQRSMRTIRRGVFSNDPLLVPTSASDKMINKTKQFLEESYNQIKSFADGLASRIKTLDTTPDEFEMEFGVRFSAEAGALISSVSTDANIIIKMKWNKET